MRTLGATINGRVPEAWIVKLAQRGAAPKALVGHPQPPIAGDPATARRLVGGVLLFDGRLIETPDPLPWHQTPPDDVWAAHLHGHGWLDDAAAAGDPNVWQHMAAWAWDWLDRFQLASGPAWRPHIVARRLTRQIAYSPQLLLGQPVERSKRLFQALGVQTKYLAWRWQNAALGVDRVEALSGLVNAQIALGDAPNRAARSIAHLGQLRKQPLAMMDRSAAGIPKSSHNWFLCWSGPHQPSKKRGLSRTPLTLRLCKEQPRP